jgi:ketosteroid isomerase-like protein
MRDYEFARTALLAVHGAWSVGDVEAMLSWYTDDLIYVCNSGLDHGKPIVVSGKDEMRAFLTSMARAADCVSVVNLFAFNEGVARANCSCVIRHRETGHALTGTYRQVAEFKGSLISRLDEYHDAARMDAFWRMVSGAEALQVP